jgi:hypothetical protein
MLTDRDRRYLNENEFWPLETFLPLKKSGPDCLDCAILISKKSKLYKVLKAPTTGFRIYLISVDDLIDADKRAIFNCQFVDFSTIDDLGRAGWTVD